MIFLTRRFNKQVKLVGLFAVALTLILGGCGNSNSQSKNSNDNSTKSSVTSSSNSTTSSKAITKARQLIADGDYEQALSTLQGISSPSTKAKNLITDLKKLIQAESDYKNGNYSSAESSTNSLQQSDTTEVSNAAASLSSKIDSAKTSSAASSSTSGTAAANNASSSTASSTTSDSTNNSVISKFASAIGLYGKSGYGFTIDSQSGSTYTIEVRQNNQANDVANLVGIYQYNSSTGAVTKTN